MRSVSSFTRSHGLMHVAFSFLAFCKIFHANPIKLICKAAIFFSFFIKISLPPPCILIKSMLYLYFPHNSIFIFVSGMSDHSGQVSNFLAFRIPLVLYVYMSDRMAQKRNCVATIGDTICRACLRLEPRFSLPCKFYYGGENYGRAKTKQC